MQLHTTLETKQFLFPISYFSRIHAYFPLSALWFCRREYVSVSSSQPKSADADLDAGGTHVQKLIVQPPTNQPHAELTR